MPFEFDLSGVNGEQLGKLLSLLSHSDVEELQLEQKGTSLSVRRPLEGGNAILVPPELPRSEDASAEAGAVIPAPAVGIFRRSQRPSEPPLVDSGARIGLDTVLGYIEVMRVPHSVTSTQEGILHDFLVEDGQPVEFGQPLATLK